MSLLLLLFVAAAEPRVVFETKSEYERIYVVDEGTLRYLRFDAPDGDDQSVVDLARPTALPMEYIRLALHGLADTRGRTRALVVGIGGGSYVGALRRLAPAMEVDAVDIDPGVVDVARRFFGFSPDERTHVFIEDGAAFVRREGPVYDLVLLDAYGAGGVPAALATDAFFAAVARRLAPGGVVVANLSVDGDAERALLAGLARAFTALGCAWTSDRSNLLVYARSTALELRGAGREARAQTLGLPSPREARRLGACPPK
jgi:spermidine synthase